MRTLVFGIFLMTLCFLNSCSIGRTQFKLRNYEFAFEHPMEKISLKDANWLLMPMSVYAYGVHEKETDAILKQTLTKHLNERLHIANTLKDIYGKHLIFEIGFDDIDS